MSGKIINAYLEWVYRELKSNLDKIEEKFILADTTDWNQAMNARGLSINSLLNRVKVSRTSKEKPQMIR